MSNTSLEEASSILHHGGVVLISTETVVGLVTSEAGLPRIREIKGRDASKATALLCASSEDAFALARDVPPLARKLADLYWPGPLTLVLDAQEGGTVGVRVPDHAGVQALLASYGEPLYATSANLSGEPAVAGLEDVDLRVSGAVDVILEGEPGSGDASAVVDLSGGMVHLLRASRGLSEGTLARLSAG